MGKMDWEDEDDNKEKYKGSSNGNQKSKTPVLDSFSRDLTELAAKGE